MSSLNVDNLITALKVLVGECLTQYHDATVYPLMQRVYKLENAKEAQERHE